MEVEEQWRITLTGIHSVGAWWGQVLASCTPLERSNSECRRYSPLHSVRSNFMPHSNKIRGREVSIEEGFVEGGGNLHEVL